MDHGYIERTLEKYGFGVNFIEYFKTLYSEIIARILINGHLSEVVKILRGVKQGYALSCNIFIICIDLIGMYSGAKRHPSTKQYRMTQTYLYLSTKK